MADPDKYTGSTNSSYKPTAPPVATGAAQPALPQATPIPAPNYPSPYQTQGTAPAYFTPTQAPAPYQAQIPQAPAPLNFNDLQGFASQVPQGQIQMPNLPNYQSVVQAPSYIAPPQFGDFQAMLTQYGLLPNTNNPQAMAQYLAAPAIGGVNFSGINTSLPDYNPTKSLDERTQAYLDMQYKGTENSINKALQDMQSEYGLQKTTQEQYGQLGDAKLAELYQQLHGNVAQGATNIAGLFGNAQSGIQQAYGDARSAVQQTGQDVTNNVQQLAERLGLSAATPEGLARIGDYQTQALGDISKNQASSQGLLDVYNSILQGANARDVSNVDTLGTSKRADLQNIVAGNLASLMHDYNTSRGDVQQQLTNLNQERGAAAVDRYATLEDQLYNRKYQKAVDEANLQGKNAELGLQASSISQQGQIASAQIQLQKQQAMYNALKDTQQFAFQNANLQYMSQKDYNDAMQNYFNNSFSAQMQQAGMGIDVGKFNAQMGQNAFGLGLNAANFVSNQNQQQFNNNMDIQQFGANLQNQNFSQWLGQNQFGANLQNQNFSQWLNQNQFGANLQNQNYNQANGATTTAANLQNQNFNQNMQIANFGIDSQVAAANINNQIRSGNIQAAQLALDQLKVKYQGMTLPLEIQQLQANIDLAKSGTAQNYAQVNGTGAYAPKTTTTEIPKQGAGPQFIGQYFSSRGGYTPQQASQAQSWLNQAYAQAVNDYVADKQTHFQTYQANAKTIQNPLGTTLSPQGEPDPKFYLNLYIQKNGGKSGFNIDDLYNAAAVGWGI